MKPTTKQIKIGDRIMYKGWSFRVVKDADPKGIYYAISRVYSDENRDNSNIEDLIACPVANTFEGLVNQLQEMLEACKKPVLEYNTGEQVN
jgi:hypothetical protein